MYKVNDEKFHIDFTIKLFNDEPTCILNEICTCEKKKQIAKIGGYICTFLKKLLFTFAKCIGL